MADLPLAEAWAWLQKSAYDSRLLLELLEPVPKVRIPEPLTYDLVKYMYKTASKYVEEHGSITPNDFWNVMQLESAAVLTPNNPDTDGEILWHMLSGNLPPRAITEADFHAFLTFVSRHRKAVKERAFRAEVAEWAIDVAMKAPRGF